MREWLRRWLGIDHLDGRYDGQAIALGQQGAKLSEISLKAQDAHNRSVATSQYVDALSKQTDSRAADNVAMYKLAQEENQKLYGSVNAQANRLVEVDGAFNRVMAMLDEASKQAADINILISQHRDKYNTQTTDITDRLVALETASKDLGSHLNFIAENAKQAQIERAVKIILNAQLPFFRASHRETLVKMIRSEK